MDRKNMVLSEAGPFNALANQRRDGGQTAPNQQSSHVHI
jgi:hypothetical protein